MNFLKNTVKKAANGVELETLKFERGNLKEDIRKLREKIAIHDKKYILKTTLSDASTDILRILTTLSPECSVENVFKEDTIKSEKSDHDQTTMSYTECLRISHKSLNSSYDELKNIIEKLEKELIMGTERYIMDIDQKTARISVIDDKLSVLRGKGVL
jgi:hypothetical protein